MKRYLAFYGDDYYPSGGMSDFVKDCDTLEECEKEIEQKHKENRPDDDEWAWAWKQIWDSHKREFVVNTFD
jgi:hypothetical protein